MINTIVSSRKIECTFPCIETSLDFKDEDLTDIELFFRGWERNSSKEYSGGRTDISIGSPEFDQLAHKSRIIRELKDMVTSLSFWQHLASEIKVNSETLKRINEINKLTTEFKKEGIFERGLQYLRRSGYVMAEQLSYKILKGSTHTVTMNVGVSYSGYQVPPHLDNRNKFIVGLIYLAGSSDQNLVICHPKNSTDIGKRWIPIEETFVDAKVRQDPGKCVFFENTECAYHATETFEQREPKIFVYVAIAKVGTESVFKEKPGYLRDFWPSAV